MRKLVLFILTMCMVCISAVAMAEKPYKHPQYTLTNVRQIIVTDIDSREVRATRKFFSDEAAEEKMMGAIFDAASRQNLIVEDARSYGKPDAEGVPRHFPTKLEMKVVINNFGYYNETTPGHYETRYRNQTVYYYDNMGVRRSRTESVPYEVWIEPETYNVAKLNASYSLYDIETGELVASMTANRDRSYESDATGMANRSVRDFFQKVLKK